MFKKILAILWLIVSVFLGVFLFINSGFASDKVLGVVDLRTSPYFTGGKVIETIEKKEYKITIHEPVYQGFPKRKKYGYIQVEWIWENPPKGTIKEVLDLDLDGKDDLLVGYDTGKKTITWTSLNDDVLGPMVSNSTLTYMRVAKENDLGILHYDKKRVIKVMIKRGFADKYYKL